MRKPIISIIGVGPMARALSLGLGKAGYVTRMHRRKQIDYGSVIVICVGHDDMEEFMASFKHPGVDSLVVSCVAGYKLNSIDKHVKYPVIRMMPNIAVEVNKGTIIYAHHPSSTSGQVEDFLKIFKTLGTMTEMLESRLDKYTRLTGSGPAYVELLIDTLEEAATSMGLKNSRKLLIDMVEGSAACLRTDKVAARVATKGGVTEKILKRLKKKKFKKILKKAILKD